MVDVPVPAMMTDTWKLTFGEVVPCCIDPGGKKENAAAWGV
jgi:hypothetical protein